MADLKTPADVTTYIKGHVKPRLEKAIKAHGAIKARMPAELKKLDAAIKDSDAEGTRLGVGAMRQHLKNAELALGWIDDVLDDIDLISESDIDFTADEATLDAISNKLKGPKTEVAGWIKLGNALILKGDGVAKTAANVEKAALADWSHVMAYARMRAAIFDKRVETAKALAKRAEAAGSARDGDALAKVLAELKPLENAMDLKFADELDQRRKVFNAKYDTRGFDAGFAAQIERDNTECDKLGKSGDEARLAANKLMQKITETQLAPVDIAKAIKVLGLKPAQAAALKKAIDGSESALPKALEALAREAGLKTTGKDMVARLVREKVL